MSGRILVVVAAVLLSCGSEAPGGGSGHGGSGGQGGTGVSLGTGGGGTGGGTVGVGGAGAAPPPFFPTMFVTIDGIRKSYRLSSLRQGAVMTSPTTTGADMVVIEFATGLRNLGAEATPGEFYSEIWLWVTTGGQTPVAGAYDCLPAGSSPLPGQRALQATWSFNHGVGLSWTDYSTFRSGGPCTATFQDLGTAPGDRIRGTFAATVDGGHVLSEGAFDLVVPDTLVPGQP